MPHVQSWHYQFTLEEVVYEQNYVNSGTLPDFKDHTTIEINIERMAIYVQG